MVCHTTLSAIMLRSFYIKMGRGDAWVTPSVKRLPSAQVMISGSWDRAPSQDLCSARSLLGDSLSLPLASLALSHSLVSIK